MASNPNERTHLMQSHYTTFLKLDAHDSERISHQCTAPALQTLVLGSLFYHHHRLEEIGYRSYGKCAKTLMDLAMVCACGLNDDESICCCCCCFGSSPHSFSATVATSVPARLRPDHPLSASQALLFSFQLSTCLRGEKKYEDDG